MTPLFHHRPTVSSIFVFFLSINNNQYILNPTRKNISQELCTESSFLVKNLALNSKKKKLAIIEKNVENSRLSTVLKENGSIGLSQFLKRGITIGVFSAHLRNCSPNLLLKNCSSAKIIGQ